MKDFNYNDYLKNNPLLRKNSISIEQAEEIARQAEDFDDAVIQLEDMGMSMQQAEQIASQYHDMSSSSLNENKNPELEKKIVNFLRSLAKYYGYSIFDAYQAVEQVLARKADEFGEGKYDVGNN